MFILPTKTTVRTVHGNTMLFTWKKEMRSKPTQNGKKFHFVKSTALFENHNVEMIYDTFFFLFSSFSHIFCKAQKVLD